FCQALLAEIAGPGNQCDVVFARAAKEVFYLVFEEYIAIDDPGVGSDAARWRRRIGGKQGTIRRATNVFGDVYNGRRKNIHCLSDRVLAADVAHYGKAHILWATVGKRKQWIPLGRKERISVVPSVGVDVAARYRAGVKELDILLTACQFVGEVCR